MKIVYLIHGWGGSDSSEAWFGWLKRELKKRKIKLSVFNMPNTEYPKIKEWISFLEASIKNAGQETYFIGHSIGCQTIMRYLERLPEKIKIAGAVFIAGWFNLKGLTEQEKIIAKPWLENKIDFEKIKKHTQNFLAIFSDDDPVVPVTDSSIFRKRLGSRIIIKKKEGHFNETREIKEIIEFIEK